MSPFWKGLHGRTGKDTLAFWINRAFSRLFPAQAKHWLAYPFDLQLRRYYVPYLGGWTDGGGILWALLHYEKPDFEVSWIGRLSSGKVGIDLGAHRGYWLLLHRNKMPSDAIVFAFEPYLPNIPYLSQNLYENGVKNVVILQLAASAGAGKVSMGVDSGPFGEMGGTAHLVQEGGDYVAYAVKVVDWVSALDLPSVDWIKMDIEGAEVAALAGALPLLERYKPDLWIEVHGTFSGLYPLLEQANYRIAGEKWYESPRAGMGHIWAVPA